MKKGLICALLGILIVSSALMGFFFGKGDSRIKNEYTALDEVSDYLQKYHYKKPTEEEIYNGALNGEASFLNDPYTNIVVPNKFEGYIGLQYAKSGNSYYIGNVLDDSPFYNTLYYGDKIISVNNTLTDNISQTAFLELFDLDINKEVKIEVERGTKKIESTKLTIKDDVCTSKKIDENTGYIKYKSFSDGSSAEFIKELKKIENGIDLLLIDLRNNGGGSLTELKNIVNEFVVNKGKSYMTLDNYDGTKEYLTTTNTIKKDYNIKILVNGYTASASECFASIMNEYMGYEIVGEKTYGKGVYQATFPLKTKPGYYLKCTIGKWYTPNGNNIDKVGITPNLKVEMNKISLPDKFDLGIDTVSATTKNLQIILRSFEYNGRIDGYFDNELENYLFEKYETKIITEELYYNILENYYDLILQQDKVIEVANS